MARSKRESADGLRRAAEVMDAMTPDLAADMRAASEALEREAAREEAERPKVTLEEQVALLEEACSDKTFWDQREHYWPLRQDKTKAAASTLKRLAEDGGRLLARKFERDFEASNACGDFLRSLGVEPKP